MNSLTAENEHLDRTKMNIASAENVQEKVHVLSKY